MTGARLEAGFAGPAGRRVFVLLHRPTTPTGGAVLFVPPFAEEMNKSRAQVAATARALAAVGRPSVIVDLYGTGDSEGELRDATFEHWRDDIRIAAGWAAERGCPVDSVVALRVGAMLAAQCAASGSIAPTRTVLWAPVWAGEQFATQFLRLRVAGSLMGAVAPETVEGLRGRVRGGETLEVAGYDVAPALLADLDGGRLTESAGPSLGATTVVDVLRSADAAVPRATQTGVAALRTRGLAVDLQTLVGEPFWAATEIVRLPALVSLTVRMLTASP